MGQTQCKQVLFLKGSGSGRGRSERVGGQGDCEGPQLAAEREDGFYVYSYTNAA